MHRVATKMQSLFRGYQNRKLKLELEAARKAREELEAEKAKLAEEAAALAAEKQALAEAQKNLRKRNAQWRKKARKRCGGTNTKMVTRHPSKTTDKSDATCCYKNASLGPWFCSAKTRQRTKRKGRRPASCTE